MNARAHPFHESETDRLQRLSLEGTFNHARARREEFEKILGDQLGAVAMVQVRMFAERAAREAVARDALERMGYEVP